MISFLASKQKNILLAQTFKEEFGNISCVKYSAKHLQFIFETRLFFCARKIILNHLWQAESIS